MDALTPQSIGWYGKLPSRGDFVGRGMPRPWLHAWDDWLQHGLAFAAQQLGTMALRERLMAMPPWQCVVLPQQHDQAAWCGVVAPSTDRVGRLFPLLLAEAYDETALNRVDLKCLQERARRLADWLKQAGNSPSPKEFGLGATQLAATPWRGEPTASADTFAGLRVAWPAAASFWWRTEPPGDMRMPLAEDWPPRESLVLDLLAEAR
jgi:type VI secretion system protein ImpM